LPSRDRRADPAGKAVMNDSVTRSVRESYDRLAEEYARRVFDELQHKPLDRALLKLLALHVADHGEICDIPFREGDIFALELGDLWRGRLSPGVNWAGFRDDGSERPNAARIELPVVTGAQNWFCKPFMVTL
jgi:hypothetical protein